MESRVAELRVGVVGHGRWGRVHLDAFARHANTELVAVCGRDRGRTAASAAAYGAIPFTDLDSFLACGLDLVSVVLPDAYHFHPTMRILQAHIPCFAEKPLAMVRDEARELLRLAEAGKTPFGINFNHRFALPFQHGLMAVRNGAVGPCAYALWKFTGGHWPELQPSLAHLIYMQSHGFNMLTTFCGPVRDVTCVAAAPRDEDGLTTATVTMRFEQGGVGVLVASVDASYEYSRIHSFELLGLDGRILVDDAIGGYTYHPAGSQVSQVWTPGFFDDAARSFAATTERHLDVFVRAILEGRQVPIPAREGYEALLLAEAAIVSERERRTISVDADD